MRIGLLATTERDPTRDSCGTIASVVGVDVGTKIYWRSFNDGCWATTQDCALLSSSSGSTESEGLRRGEAFQSLRLPRVQLESRGLKGLENARVVKDEETVLPMIFVGVSAGQVAQRCSRPNPCYSVNTGRHTSAVWS